MPSDACGGVCEENPMYKLTLSGIDVKPEKREAGQGRQVRDFSDFTEEQLAALLVGYGSGIPFAGFLDTAFPETICDKEGKPLTCNDHRQGIMDMCHQQSKIKESILFSIWMDLPESGELRGRRKCCWHVRLIKRRGTDLEKQWGQSVRKHRLMCGSHLQ